MEHMDLTELTQACAGTKAAIRARIQLEPVGGPGDKVFPPTHKGGIYAEETRIIRDGERLRTCKAVLIDSVQSQANRLEQFLAEPISEKLQVPRISLTLNKRTITSLDAPHRIYDAFFHDSVRDDQAFRQSEVGRSLVNARPADARALFRYAPNALLFGAWDSRSDSLQGARFARALVSEIVALDAEKGRRTSSRICPYGIRSTEIYEGKDEPYTFDPEKAQLDRQSRPIQVKVTEKGHSNIPPKVEDGGITAREILHTIVVSLTQLRQLCFGPNEDVSNAGRAVLAAMGLYAVMRQIESGYTLRSRCQLLLTALPEFEMLKMLPADDRQTFILSVDEVRTLLIAAVRRASDLGLAWEPTPYQLEPADRLIELANRSEALAASVPQE